MIGVESGCPSGLAVSRTPGLDVPATTATVTRVVSVLVMGCTLSMPTATAAPNCPLLLEEADRLVLVTLDRLASATATMRLFARPHAGGDWRPYHFAEPVVLGVNGAAWNHEFRHLGAAGDPVKREGDYRTPAGVFALGRPFGFAPSPLADYLQIRPDTVCVDDPTSDAYNTITRHNNVGQTVSVERMRSGPLYRLGLMVRYPTNAAARAGSCIFIHVWNSPESGTAGCIALPEVRVAALQEFTIQRNAVLAVLPDAALDRLAHCLPSAADERYRASAGRHRSNK